MKALILAAGFGSRLMPLTENNPKCMVEYNGRKIIDYEIEALKKAGICEVAVVGGYLFDTLKSYLHKFDIAAFYENKKYDKTNMVSTMFCAREFLESCISTKSDLIISYADIVYFSDTISKLKDSIGELNIVVDKAWRSLWERRFANPLDDAESLKIKNGKIVELGKKASSYDDIEGQYTGLFKMSYKFLSDVVKFYDFLNRYDMYDGKDFDNMYMTSFLQRIIDKYNNANPVFIEGNWCEIDFKSDLEIVINGK